MRTSTSRPAAPGRRLVDGPAARAVPPPAPGRRPRCRTRRADERSGRPRRRWRERLDRVEIACRPERRDARRTLRSPSSPTSSSTATAPAIQPGSRSYERSWIRDGALTSAALLRLGHAEEVREFLEWFAPYQFANGKVPCCVDRRGADPVPEHDSHGEFIFLVAEYLRYTGDRALVATRCGRGSRRPSATSTRCASSARTEEYRAPDKREFFGLLPPSISHEGYSAKPMHSYWDDFFALRGFEDAACAGRRARPRANEAAAWAAIRDEFRRDLLALDRARCAQPRHRLRARLRRPRRLRRHLDDDRALSRPAADADLPARGARAHLRALLARVRRARRDGQARRGRPTRPTRCATSARSCASAGASAPRELARLAPGATAGRPGGSSGPRSSGATATTPRFIGDMPHTWVGSDFIRSVLDMLAYERGRDGALVLGAGVPMRVARGRGRRASAACARRTGRSRSRCVGTATRSASGSRRARLSRRRNRPATCRWPPGPRRVTVNGDRAPCRPPARWSSPCFQPRS